MRREGWMVLGVDARRPNMRARPERWFGDRAARVLIPKPFALNERCRGRGR